MALWLISSHWFFALLSVPVGKTTSTSTSEVEAEAEAETEAEAEAEAEYGQRLHERSRKIHKRGMVDSAYNYLVALSFPVLSRSNTP